MKTKYSTNLSDAQWHEIAWAMPAAAERGRPRKWPWRTLLDAMLYAARAGGAWHLLPGDFPPWQTVYWWFARFCREGLWERLLALLRSLARLFNGRKPLPSAAILDSQSVRTARQKGPRGYDGAKRIKGRKRQLLTDTLGLPLALEVTAGNVQDRTAAWALLPAWLAQLRSLRRLWADQGYKSEPLRAALRPKAELEFVGATPGQKGFAVQPCRWRIEGSFSWASNWRRLRSDYEQNPLHSRAFFLSAFTGLLLNRLCR